MSLHSFRPFLASSRPSDSAPFSSSFSPSHRSHALFRLFVLLVLLDCSIASPYYERDWRGEDDVPVFETDGSPSGSLASSSFPPSISIPHTRPETGIETTTDRQIRPTTITSLPTVPSPQLVPAQSTTPSPTVISTSLPTTVSEAEVSNGLEQNTRMMEIVANLTKKLDIKPVAGTGADTSISFTPDELKKLQEIMKGAADPKMKANFDDKRHQLLIPAVPAKSAPQQYDYIKFTKEIRTDETEDEEFEEISEVAPVLPTVVSPDVNSTVIIAILTPPPMDVEELEEFQPFEPIPDAGATDSPIPQGAPRPIGDVREEIVRPALCDLKTDDESMSIIWALLQSRIREFGYDREQSTVLALVTFGLLLDSNQVVIPIEESNLWNDAVAAIHCLFRSCELAMPNRQFEQRLVKVPEIPRKKREPLEFESSLFECRCPTGYVFV